MSFLVQIEHNSFTPTVLAAWNKSSSIALVFTLWTRVFSCMLLRGKGGNN